VIAALAASIYGTSVETLRKELPYSPYDNAIVEDAIARQIKVNGGSAKAATSIRDNVIPLVVHFPDKRCVVLKWPAGSVGGEPIYCYTNEHTVLLHHFNGGQ
jgi:hypothetical protein